MQVGEIMKTSVSTPERSITALMVTCVARRESCVETEGGIGVLSIIRL